MTLASSPTAVMMNAALVNAIPACFPLAIPLIVYVIGAAYAAAAIAPDKAAAIAVRTTQRNRKPSMIRLFG